MLFALGVLIVGTTTWMLIWGGFIRRDEYVQRSHVEGLPVISAIPSAIRLKGYR